MPAGIPVCKARPTVSTYADASSPANPTCCLIRVRPSTSSNVKTNLARAPGAGNSKTALPGCSSATRHSIRPELLVCVTPSNTHREWPLKLHGNDVGIDCPVDDIRRKVPSKLFRDGAFNRVFERPFLVHLDCLPSLCGEDSTSRLVAESSATGKLCFLSSIGLAFFVIRRAGHSFTATRRSTSWLRSRYNSPIMRVVTPKGITIRGST